MPSELDEQAIRQTFRIVCDPYWQVHQFFRGQWVVAYYCSTEDGAARRLEKCVQRALQWQRMTPEDRITSVLRYDK